MVISEDADIHHYCNTNGNARQEKRSKFMKIIIEKEIPDQQVVFADQDHETQKLRNEIIRQGIPKTIYLDQCVAVSDIE